MEPSAPAPAKSPRAAAESESMTVMRTVRQLQCTMVEETLRDAVSDGEEGATSCVCSGVLTVAASDAPNECSYTIQ